MRPKFGIPWTIFVFGALQLSHYSCANDVQNQNEATAIRAISSATPTTKAKETTPIVNEGKISQSTSASTASSLANTVTTDRAKTTVNLAAPTTVPTTQTDVKQQTTISVVTTAMSTSTRPPTTLVTSPPVTSSVTTVEPKMTQTSPIPTPSQGTTQTHSVTETTNSPKQTSVASLTTEKIKDAHTPTTESSTASSTTGNTLTSQKQSIATSPTQPPNTGTSSTQPSNNATSTQPPNTTTSSTQTGGQGQSARESGSQHSSAVLTTTPADPTKSPAETKSFNRSIKWTDAKKQEDKNDVVLKVCWELLKNMNSNSSCIIEGNQKNKDYTFTSVHVAADLSTVQQIYSHINRPKETPEEWHMPEVLPAILASCGALVFILLAFVLCYTCHGRLYRKNQQQLTEEMQTVENGYHDNPTLEVMEFQPEMQEKKPPLNGEFNDSWIVPIDNLPKDDFSEEEDTHL